MEPRKAELGTKKPELIETDLVEREKLTLDQVCAREGMTVDKLPDRFKEVAADFRDYCVDSVSMSRSINPDIDFIYQCWQATRQLKPGHILYNFSKSLDSFDSFIQTYLPDTNSELRGKMIERIDMFRYYQMNVRRIIEVWDQEDRHADQDGIYEYLGEWVRLSGGRDYYAKYADAAIIREVIEILKSGGLPANLYHATGSAALDGIQRHGALLASHKAIEKGEVIKTGEAVTQSWKPGAGNVYTEESFEEFGYATVRWFDEFKVGFGTTKDSVLKYRSGEKGKKDIWFHNLAGEGIRIGTDLPLRFITLLTTEYEHLDKLRAWARKNAPQAKIVSAEAISLINGIWGESFSKLHRFKLEEWVQLLNTTKPIII